jgi:hypothetical protein
MNIYYAEVPLNCSSETGKLIVSDQWQG